MSPFSELGILLAVRVLISAAQLLHSINSAALVKLPREGKAFLPNTTDVSKGIYCGCL